MRRNWGPTCPVFKIQVTRENSFNPSILIAQDCSSVFLPRKALYFSYEEDDACSLPLNPRTRLRSRLTYLESIVNGWFCYEQKKGCHTSYESLWCRKTAPAWIRRNAVVFSTSSMNRSFSSTTWGKRSAQVILCSIPDLGRRDWHRLRPAFPVARLSYRQSGLNKWSERKLMTPSFV
jgi:hypothetical protein